MHEQGVISDRDQCMWKKEEMLFVKITLLVFEFKTKSFPTKSFCPKIVPVDLRGHTGSWIRSMYCMEAGVVVKDHGVLWLTTSARSNVFLLSGPLA